MPRDIYAHLGLPPISERERAATRTLEADYPAATFERSMDGTVRATGPDWPHPVRAGSAAELADALSRLGR